MQSCTVCSVTCPNSGLSDLWTAVTTVTLISNCRTVPLKLIDPELLQTFPKFYGARRFTAVFTTPHYLSHSQVQTLPSCPFKIHFNIILPRTLCSKWSLSIGLSNSLPFIPTRATFDPPSFSHPKQYLVHVQITNLLALLLRSNTINVII